jgi:hypothetical protein
LSNCEHNPPFLAEKRSGPAVFVTLRGFSLDVLAALSGSGSDPDETVKAAVGRYLADRALRPPGWQCLPLPEGPAEEGESVLEVDLGKAMGRALEVEAAAQQVSLDALVTYAVMYASAAGRGPTQPQDGTTRRRSTGNARGDRRSRT